MTRSPEEPGRPAHQQWWVIRGDSILEALTQCHENPDAEPWLVYLELVANSTSEDQPANHTWNMATEDDHARAWCSCGWMARANYGGADHPTKEELVQDLWRQANDPSTHTAQEETDP